MRMPFRLRLNLQYFATDDVVGGGDVTTEPITEPTEPAVQETDPVVETPATQEPGTEQQPEITPEQDFESRIAEERQRWEQETSERYGNYDNFNRMAQFFMQQSGYNNIDSMMQAIEQQELLQRAEQAGITPEIQQRLEGLEQRAQRAEELERQQEQQQLAQRFRGTLESFSQEKGADADALEQFMLENQVPNFEVAYNAMRAQQLEADMANAKEIAIKEYLESKKAPKVEGSGATGVVAEEPTTDFNVARQRALARMRASNQQQ